MNLCSNNHDEICFEGRKCPLCEKIDEHNREVESLENEIDGLRDTIRGLEQAE